MAIWSPEVSIDEVVLVDGSAVTQPVSGSVSVSNFPATQPVSIASPVPVTGPLTDAELRATPVPVSGTVTTTPDLASSANITRVATSSSSVLLLAANPNRKGFVITTETGTSNYVALAATASLVSYTYFLGSSTVLEKSGYTGPISLIRASGNGNVQVTELI